MRLARCFSVCVLYRDIRAVTILQGPTAVHSSAVQTPPPAIAKVGSWLWLASLRLQVLQQTKRAPAQGLRSQPSAALACRQLPLGAASGLTMHAPPPTACSYCPKIT